MKLAVDVLLLPSNEVAEYAILLNATTGDERIHLGKDRRLPHITLAQGCVEQGELPACWDALREIAAQHRKIDLEISGIVRSIEWVVSLDIVPSPALHSMHKSIMDSVAPKFFSYDPMPGMFAGDGMAQMSCSWLRRFKGKADRGEYWPHITIGFDWHNLLLDTAPCPMRFTASTYALFHLGSYCTAYEQIGSMELK
jgi:2'-5' RNA ligase